MYVKEQPPDCLHEFYPLAEYCNNLLLALNDLRLCAPLACAENITNLLQESLRNTARVILAFYRQVLYHLCWGVEEDTGQLRVYFTIQEHTQEHLQFYDLSSDIGAKSKRKYQCCKFPKAPILVTQQRCHVVVFLKYFII